MKTNFFTQGLRQNTIKDLTQSNIREDFALKTAKLIDEGFHGRQLEKKVRTLFKILEDVLYHDYDKLSIYAFSRIVLALDYFLKTRDEKPDTQVGGYADDLALVNEVFDDIRGEIEAHRNWRTAQPKEF